MYLYLSIKYICQYCKPQHQTPCNIDVTTLKEAAIFTVNIAQRNQRLLVEHIDALRDAIYLVRSRHPFQIDAMVVARPFARPIYPAAL